MIMSGTSCKVFKFSCSDFLNILASVENPAAGSGIGTEFAHIINYSYCLLHSLVCFYSISTHPYIFFNQDRESITFVGFTVTEDGDLINPIDNKELEHAIMTPKLYRGLLHNKVNFNYDCKNWKRSDMINSISKVMGLKDALDPDSSYVLTYDNIIKILAIQMRFRFVKVFF